MAQRLVYFFNFYFFSFIRSCMNTELVCWKLYSPINASLIAVTVYNEVYIKKKELGNSLWKPNVIFLVIKCSVRWTLVKFWKNNFWRMGILVDVWNRTFKYFSINRPHSFFLLISNWRSSVENLSCVHFYISKSLHFVINAICHYFCMPYHCVIIIIQLKYSI